ncbi:MAG TPA: FkbM family methyltransferase, partial [Gemmataceae bacterium]|nr:FkbM family methyltransferase [Gemmataceae bacterium]
LRHWGRLLTEPAYRCHVQEERYLHRLPRRTSAEATLLGRRVRILDSLSFVYQREEIFTREVYRFPCDHDAPFVLDGGSNIGLAIIYFKQLYPRGTVVGFEPDPKACAALRANLSAFGLSDVEVHAAALWKEAGTLPFLPDDADGGRVVETGPAGVSCSVAAVRLRDYLDRPVDLLKLDIEGAEIEVLDDCRDRLANVHNLFVEYHSFADRPQALPALLALLAEAGFRLHVHPVVTSPRPFVARELNSGMDLQLNLFAFRPTSPLLR